MRKGLQGEERQFAESVSRYLSSKWSFESRLRSSRKNGFNPDLWAGFAGLGWLGLPVPEAYGGVELGDTFISLLMEELGAALIVSPYVPTVLVGAKAIEHLADAEMRADLLEKIAGGELIVGFANDEPNNLRDPLRIESTVTEGSMGYVLNGRKSTVAFGEIAGLLLVSARVGGAPDERSGIVLLLVDPKTSGVEMRSFSAFDDSVQSEITFKNVEVPKTHVVGEVGGAADLLEMLIDRGAAASAADAAGSMRAVLELTTEYARTRHQFGKPLGSNQALQHRMVDMFMMCEEAQSLVDLAFKAIASGNPDKARKDVSAAKARVGRDALAVAKEGINLHGAIGLTQEYSVGHHLKRSLVMNQSYGETCWHRARFKSATSITANT
jgi:alkylation response protein AidB-like acyl-CoA dehydrogenase